MTFADYPQVGSGWAFPPLWRMPTAPIEGVAPVAVVATTPGMDHVREAMIILLRTLPGSRVMHPKLGAGVDRYVFEARTVEVCYRLADDVRRTLLLNEPRVLVDSVTAAPSVEADDRVDVTIEYRIDRHRRPESLVVPFYVGVSS